MHHDISLTDDGGTLFIGDGGSCGLTWGEGSDG